MSPAPRVSIIVPAFDAERWLGDALRSIERQSWRPLEVVAWDDGSRDGTARALARWPARLAKRGIDCTVGAHAHGENRGPSATRNAAIAAARGELLQLLDADDILPADKVARHAARLAREPALDAVWCGAAVFRRMARAPWAGRWWSFGCPDPLAEICYGCGLPPHGPLFRRSAIERAGGPFDESLRGGEDHDLWFRMLASGARFAREPAGAPVFHRRHAANATRDRVLMRRHGAVVRRRIAAWALERGRGWPISGAAFGLAEVARRLDQSGLAAEAAACATEVPPLLDALERRAPEDWHEAWEGPFVALVEELFRAPAALPRERLLRFARWVGGLEGPSRLRSARARLALRALEAHARAPEASWPPALLRRAAHFRLLGIAAALRAGGPPGLLAMAAPAAALEDAAAAAARLAPWIS